jgi:hypothetical protein
MVSAKMPKREIAYTTSVAATIFNSIFVKEKLGSANFFRPEGSEILSPSSLATSGVWPCMYVEQAIDTDTSEKTRHAIRSACVGKGKFHLRHITGK